MFVKIRKGRNRVSYVERSYATPNEAIGAVKRLQEEGYRKEVIQLISNTEAEIAFMEQFTLDVTPENDYTNQSGPPVEEEHHSLPLEKKA